MEKAPPNPLSAKQYAVENEANYEGNDSLLLFERLHNPIIKKQIIDMLYQAEMETYEQMKNEEWEPYEQERPTQYTLLKGKKSGIITDTESLEGFSVVPSREEIAEETDRTIAEIERSTNVNFSRAEPNVNSMPATWEIPWSRMEATTKQMSIIEAHEKGHAIRRYHGSDEKFKRAFDRSRAHFTDEEYALHRRYREKIDRDHEDTIPATREEFEAQYFDYLFSSSEAAERMSQLKNYFGMKGAEPFTKEHLRYAREHYIADTGMDNGMRLFFEAITPDTEDTFIELINSAGI